MTDMKAILITDNLAEQYRVYAAGDAKGPNTGQGAGHLVILTLQPNLVTFQVTNGQQMSTLTVGKDVLGLGIALLAEFERELLFAQQRAMGTAFPYDPSSADHPENESQEG